MCDRDPLPPGARPVSPVGEQQGAFSAASRQEICRGHQHSPPLPGWLALLCEFLRNSPGSRQWKAPEMRPPGLGRELRDPWAPRETSRPGGKASPGSGGGGRGGPLPHSPGAPCRLRVCRAGRRHPPGEGRGPALAALRQQDEAQGPRPGPARLPRRLCCGRPASVWEGFRWRARVPSPPQAQPPRPAPPLQPAGPTAAEAEKQTPSAPLTLMQEAEGASRRAVRLCQACTGANGRGVGPAGRPGPPGSAFPPLLKTPRARIE